MIAIDVHAHMTTEKYTYEARYGKEVSDAIQSYYRVKEVVKTEEEMAQDFVEHGVKALIIAWDAEFRSGYPRVTNDYVAGVAQRHPEAFAGSWAMIDPWKGELALQELDHAINDLGMIGVKYQQVAQEFFPNDRMVYPFYEKCVELGCPVLFHTGNTGLGSGLPGGGGYKLKHTQPIPYIDDVAADFPKLTIVGAHPSWPWQDEMIAVLLHKSNVYNDLSGWAPKYFSPALKREINGRLQDKFFFGSDYPEIPIKRWLDEFTGGEYKPEVVEKVLYKNAQRVFGIEL